MSHDVIEQVRRYLDYAAAESITGSEASLLPVSPRDNRWYQSGPVLAGLAALMVLVVATPALLNVRQSQPKSELPAPLAVGVEYVWPEGGFTGSPEDIAAAFAREVLGWTDFTTANTDPEASADGPVWTRIDNSASEFLEVLSVPVGDDRRVLMQVGTGIIAAGPAEVGGEHSIRFPVVDSAAGAHLHVRLLDPDRVAVFQPSPSQLESGRMTLSESGRVGGVIVVYFDAGGRAVTAVGGHFGPFVDSPGPDDQAQVEIAQFNVSLTYPGRWHLADSTLTPALGNPREVFSVGSFPLRPGGPRCAQAPTQALHDMEPTDVFLTVQERVGEFPSSGFDPRPGNFGPALGSSDNVFYDCLDPDERADIGVIHWIWFSDQDRYFHVLVALGGDASSDDTAAIWKVLDQMEIRPRN